MPEPISAAGSVGGADFNGDGYTDLAVGAPGEDIGRITDAGAVNIIYGSANGLSATTTRPDQIFHQNSPNIAGVAEQNDEFGAALGAGDFNGDGYTDLAVGAPGETIGIKRGAGAVNIIYGSANGLSATTTQPDQVFVDRHESRPEWGDRFGAAVVAGDFDADGYDDLAIGIPFQAGSYPMAYEENGAVQVIFGTTDGLTVGFQAFPSSRYFAPGGFQFEPYSRHEPYGQFGSALEVGDFNADGYDDLAVGAPGILGGKIFLIYGSSSNLRRLPLGIQRFSQDTPDIAGTGGTIDYDESFDQFGFALGAGDFNGDGYTDLAIGVPFEDIGEILRAGAVNIIYGSAGGLSATASRSDQLFHQNSPDIAGTAEDRHHRRGDRFGYALGAGDFNGDSNADLAIGVPFEDIGEIADAGAVNVIYGSAGGLSATATRSDQLFHQNSVNIAGSAEDGDQFGR